MSRPTVVTEFETESRQCRKVGTETFTFDVFPPSIRFNIRRFRANVRQIRAVCTLLSVISSTSVTLKRYGRIALPMDITVTVLPARQRLENASPSKLAIILGDK